jgi:hypothetical protein
MPQREKKIDISAPWIRASENRTPEKKISEIGAEETQGERRSRNEKFLDRRTSSDPCFPRRKRGHLLRDEMTEKGKLDDSEPAARRRLKPSKD